MRRRMERAIFEKKPYQRARRSVPNIFKIGLRDCRRLQSFAIAGAYPPIETLAAPRPTADLRRG
jgi:hypothetical protein